MKFVFVIALLFASAHSFAQSVEVSDETMIRVGGGTMVSGPHVGVVLKVEGEASVSPTGIPDARYIFARVNAEASVAGELQYADVDFRSLGYGMKWQDAVGEGFVDFTLLDAGFTRNIDLGNSHVQRVSIVGIEAKYAVDLGTNVKLLLSTALDLWGHGEFERQDMSRVSGSTTTGKVEAGVEIAGKYRVVFGAKSEWLAADPIAQNSGVWCDPNAYYDNAIYDTNDPNYNGAFIGPTGTTCFNTSNTKWLKHASESSLYLRVVADLTKNLQAFGVVSYGVFKITDDRGDIGSSSNTMMQFRFGVSYLIR